MNLADLRWNLPLLLCAGAVSLGCFCSKIIPKAVSYPSAAISGYAGYSQLRQALDAIPPASSVTASTFYTTHLSRRAVLYDLDYCSRAQLLSTDYIVFSPGSAPEAYGGPKGFPAYLTAKGYTLHTRVDDRLVIFERKP